MFVDIKRFLFLLLADAKAHKGLDGLEDDQSGDERPQEAVCL